MENKIEVSIIILNYKTPKMCCDCIQSLREKSSGFSYEIIVIDNDSQDNSLEQIHEVIGDTIVYYQNNENAGTAKAFNLGARLAKGDYLFYLNTDTLFVNNAIKAQLDFIRSRDDVAIVGGNLYNSRKEPTHSHQRIYFGMENFKKQASLFGVLKYKLTKNKKNMEFNYTNEPIAVDYVCAAATLMRKDIYLKLGGFNEEIFIYGDEALYAYQCKQNGYLSYNVPESKIIHFEGDSFKKDENNFSEGRVRRYYNGMSVHIREIYGKENLIPYFKYRKKAFKNKRILSLLLFKKAKARNYKLEMDIIDEYIKKCGE